MMPEGYSYEIRETAKELYVVDGRTYEQVSELTGVSVPQLKRWGSEDVPKWMDARREYRSALSSIKADTVRLRAKLVKAALDSGDPQAVYAFAAIEKAAAAVGKKGSDPVPEPAPERLKNINTPADAVEALQEVVELKLNKMLAQPDVLQLSQVRELKQTMELIDQMKTKYIGETGSDDHVPDAAKIKEIREMLNL